MSEKKLPKGLLEDLVELTRKVYDVHEVQNLDETIKARIEAAKRLEAICEGVDWINFHDLSSAVYALADEDADLLEQMCKVLEFLGWQVVDDERSDG